MENKSLKNWLSFSKKERNALIILIVLVGSFFLAPYFFPKKEMVLAAKETMATPDKLTETSNTTQLFSFDPNTIDSVGWKKLGLKDKTIRTIIHYREKGGRFRMPEDIRKIYGLHKEDADRLIPYIQIGEQKMLTVSHHNFKTANVQYSFPMEINKAGADHWAALPGISTVLAQRIVHYRDAIHGFKSIDQVAKTYGLSPAAFSKIKPYLRLSNGDDVVAVPNVTTNLTEKQAVAELTDKYNMNSAKVNINTASEQELLLQKRIPKSVAKAIVIYREQHGQYQQVADIKKIVFINDDMYDRISPFLTIE